MAATLKTSLCILMRSTIQYIIFILVLNYFQYTFLYRLIWYYGIENK